MTGVKQAILWSSVTLAVAALPVWWSYQAYEDDAVVNQVHDSLTLMGRGLETSTDDIRACLEHLESDLGASRSEARSLVKAFGC